MSETPLQAWARRLNEWARTPVGQAWIRAAQERKQMSDATMTNERLEQLAVWWAQRHGNPDAYRSAAAPDYLHSVDEALTLPLDEGYRWSIFGADDYWWVDIIDDAGNSDDRASACEDTASRAICAAWMAWMDAQEAE